MKVLGRKLRRDLWASGGMLVAISAIMALGIACYASMAANYRNLLRGQLDYYAQCRMADFSVEVKKVPLADLEAVARLHGVTEIRTRIQSFVTVDVPDELEPINGVVVSLPDERQPVINDVVLRQGSYFTDRRANEVIVNDAFAREHGLYPGEWIHILVNDRRQELYIVGTAISSEFTYLLGPGQIVPDPHRFGAFYLKRSFAEEVFDFEGAANQVLGLLAPAARAQPDLVLARIETLLAPYGVLSTTPRKDQASHRFLDNEIQSLRSFGMIMPTIFLVAASLVLNMLMTRLVENQRVIVGTLKALGYSDRQLFMHFLEFGLALGAISGLVGCGGGYLLAKAATEHVYSRLFQFPNLVNRFYPDAYATAVLIAVAFGLIGSLHGARQVLKLDPAVAMRPKPPASGGAIWLERWPWFWRRLSFGTRVTLRNVIRQRMRSLAGIFAAAMGASLCVNTLMMGDATDYMIEFQFQMIQQSDVDLVFKDEQGIEALAEVAHLPGVDYAEPSLDVACTFFNGPYSRKGGITGLRAGARLVRPRDARGRPIRVPSAGLVMSRKLAEVLHLESGDYVLVRPMRGLRRPQRVPVVEVSDSYLGLAVYADLATLSRLVDEELAMTGAQLLVDPAPASMRALYRELKQLPGVQNVTLRKQAMENLVQSLIETQRVFLSMLIAFSGCIFFGSVLNASLISLAERQREVATLRVLGYDPWQISGLFLREALLLNIIGTLVGLPLGYLLSWAVTLGYDTEWIRIPLVSPLAAWLQTLVIGTVFGLLAHLFVHRAIVRQDWLDALKTKE